MSHSAGKKQQLQNVVDDIHGDVDLNNPRVEVEHSQPDYGNGMEVAEIEVVRPMLPGEGQQVIEATQSILKDGGSQIVITVRKPFWCPSCRYIPKYDAERYDETPELKVLCRECSTMTCTECRVECSKCERDMCSGCSYGYTTEEGPLCYLCRQDAVKKDRFEAGLEVWKNEHENEAMLLEHETRRVLRFRELELQGEIEREQRRLQTFVEWSKHQDRVSQREIEEKRVVLDYMLNRRGQALDEFEAAAKYYLQNEAQEMQRQMHDDEMDFRREQHRDEMEFQRLQHDDQMNLEHRKQRYNEQKEAFRQYVEAQKMELGKIERLLKVDGHPNPEQKLRKVAEATKRLNELNQTPTIGATIQ
jgi:hypothetical protein